MLFGKENLIQKFIQLIEIMSEEDKETLKTLKRKQRTLTDNKNSMLDSLLPVLNDLKQVNKEIDNIEFYDSLD